MKGSSSNNKSNKLISGEDNPTFSSPATKSPTKRAHSREVPSSFEYRKGLLGTPKLARRVQSSPNPLRKTPSCPEGGEVLVLSDEVFEDGDISPRDHGGVRNWLYESPVVSIRSGNHPTAPSKTKSAVELTKMEFNKMPFSFYRSSVDSWKSPILQGVVVTSALALIPFIIMVIIFIVVKTRFRPTMTKFEKRRETFLFIPLFLITLVKDFILLVIIISVTTNLPLSIYRIAYPPFLLTWLLLFCILPIVSVYYAEQRYLFVSDPAVKKTIAKIAFKPNLNPSIDPDVQKRYLSKSYPIMSVISGSNDEYTYLRRTTSDICVCGAVITALIICIIRTVPSTYETSMILLSNKNITANETHVGPYDITNRDVTNDVISPVELFVLSLLSSFNSFVIFLFFSAWVLYVLLWKVTMLHEWRSFVSNERDDMRTLFNKGSQATCLWWKIYQTLRLYTDSSISMTAFLNKILVYSLIIVSSSISVLIIVCIVSKDGTLDVWIKTSLTIDNVLYYTVLMTQHILTSLIEKEQRLAENIMEIKKLNVGYEICCLSNLNDDMMEIDPNVRMRSQLLSGQHILLGEMTSAVEHIRSNECSRALSLVIIIVGVLVMVSLYALGSTFADGLWENFNW